MCCRPWRASGWSWTRGVTLDVVYPPEAMLTGTTSDVNNASVVMRLVYGETSFLLTGDIHWDVESYILHRGLPIRSDVLKVAHQGSRTSSLPAFVREVAPRAAVISVGADNQFGHPASGDPGHPWSDPARRHGPDHGAERHN